MSVPLLTVGLRYEQDVVTVRQRARQVADLLGFEAQDQIRIATAVSEIARNAYGYGQGGRVEFSWDSDALSLIVRVSDTGPGIENLPLILGGQYRSSTGMGLGILGARRLADRFEIETVPGMGTVVLFEKRLGRKSGVLPDLTRVAQALTQDTPGNAFQEVQRQNQELLRALSLVQAHEAELAEMNRELEETNRGVLALYAELDEKAVSLQRSSELKSRFLANMSHEFRTPLSSILSLTRLLGDEIDGSLSPEQEKQVGFIRQSAQSLLDLVIDLLDLAKIESGKIDVRISAFDLPDVFSALRGMFKPLLPRRPLNLVFEDAPCSMQTDENKVAQILRNLIANAIKFTPEGEVRVRAAVSDGIVTITVCDTGIGISPEHWERVFDEFHQVQGTWQDKASGTGLGLPLSRRLAELLGGSLTLQSAPDDGATFQVTLPCIHPSVTQDPARTVPGRESHHA